MKGRIDRGDLARDTVTGYEGIVIARSLFAPKGVMSEVYAPGRRISSPPC